MRLSTGGRHSLGLTPEDMKARKLEQCKASKARRKELVDQLKSEGQALCRHELCIQSPTMTGYCEHHQALRKAKADREQPCLKCNGIAMPHSRLCGFHQEEAEDKRHQTRIRNRAARRLKVAEAVKEVQLERSA